MMKMISAVIKAIPPDGVRRKTKASRRLNRNGSRECVRKLQSNMNKAEKGLYDRLHRSCRIFLTKKFYHKHHNVSRIDKLLTHFCGFYGLCDLLLCLKGSEPQVILSPSAFMRFASVSRRRKPGKFLENSVKVA